MNIKTITLNSRSYVIFLNIAKNALKTIEKIRTSANVSQQTSGDWQSNRPDREYIFFTIPQLSIISFDYAFSALENFFEHIGFILIDNWDSNGEQRHYSKKQKRLLNASDIFANNNQSTLNYSEIEEKWLQIIKSADLNKYNKQRNRLKHTHAGIHDIKSETSLTNGTENFASEYDDVNKETMHSLTESDCSGIIKTTESLINSVYKFLKQHEFILHILNNNSTLNAARKNLLTTFLGNPYYGPMYYGSESISS